MKISLKHKPKEVKGTPRMLVEDFEVKNGVKTLKRIHIISISYGHGRNP